MKAVSLSPREAAVTEHGFEVESIHALIEHRVTGEPSEEVLEVLRAARPRFNELARPGFVEVLEVPETSDTMFLENGSHSLSRFRVKIGEINGSFRRHQGGWELATSVELDSLDLERLSELDHRIHRIGELFLGPRCQIEPDRCEVALYFSSPERLKDIAEDVITRTRAVHLAQWAPLGGYSYGTERGGFEAMILAEPLELQVSGFPVPEARANAGRHLKDPTFKAVRFVFHRERIRELISYAGGSAPDLPALLRDLMRGALGDQVLPTPAFRVATQESRGRRNRDRPSRPSWLAIREAFSEAMP